MRNVLIFKCMAVRKIVTKIGDSSTPDWRNFAFVWGQKERRS